MIRRPRYNHLDAEAIHWDCLAPRSVDETDLPATPIAAGPEKTRLQTYLAGEIDEARETAPILPATAQSRRRRATEFISQ